MQPRYLIEIIIPLYNGEETKYYFIGFFNGNTNSEYLQGDDHNHGFEGSVDKEKAFVFYDLKLAQRTFLKLTRGYIFKNIRIVNL